MLKKYLITILLIAAMCSPALSGELHRQSDTSEREIKKSVIAIGRTGKEAGKIIGQSLKEIGKQTGKVFNEMAKSLKDAEQKDLK